MKQFEFEQQNEQFWFDFEQEIKQWESNAPVDSVRHFAKRYRTLCHHAAQAESRQYSPTLISDLQRLSARAHHILYSHQSHYLSRFARWLVIDLPRNVRAEKTVVIWSHILFYLPFLLFFLLCTFNILNARELVGLSALQAEHSYAEMAKRTAAGENRPFNDNILMFGWYIFNNISIAFQAAASGLLFAIGTIYILVMNGYMIGAIFGHMTNVSHDISLNFFGFVATHGAFELTGIVLSGAAGLKLGMAIVNPQGYSRKDALKMQGKSASQLIAAAFLFLFIAAFLEAFWSPITVISPYFKMTVALFCWIAVYAYLLLGGRKQ